MAENRRRVPLIVGGILPFLIAALIQIGVVLYLFVNEHNYEKKPKITSVRIFNYPYGMEKIIDSLRNNTSYTHIADEEHSIFCLLEKYNVKFSDWVLAQTLLETGYYQSRIFRMNNNLFGMKVSSRGYHIPVESMIHQRQCGDKVHACYESIVRSVQDYAAWQEIRMADYERKYGKIKNGEQYLKFLDNIVIGNISGYRYAEDKNYTSKLRKLVRKNRCTPDILVEERLVPFFDTLYLDGKLTEIIYY